MRQELHKQHNIMEKRTFLKSGLLLGFVAASSSFLDACKTAVKSADAKHNMAPPTKRRSGPFTLPPLGFDPAALEPNIDKLTMEIHHDRHHKGYVNHLNDAIKGTMYADYELDDILARIGTSDADKGIRNNAGGHWNHTQFWQVLMPGGSGMPDGKLAAAINATFGSYDKFAEQFDQAAKGVFGSGWAWLCVGKDNKLFICSTPNQDNPLMTHVAKQTGAPILGVDVWEHAYYLKYQNKRPDYLGAFHRVINWKVVADRYDKAMM